MYFKNQLLSEEINLQKTVLWLYRLAHAGTYQVMNVDSTDRMSINIDDRQDRDRVVLHHPQGIKSVSVSRGCLRANGHHRSYRLAPQLGVPPHGASKISIGNYSNEVADVVNDKDGAQAFGDHFIDGIND